MQGSRLEQIVTYQLVLAGHDGVVLASDRCEVLSPGDGDSGKGSSKNLLTKIRVNETCQMAWAFSGGKVGAIAAAYLTEELSRWKQGSIEDAEECLKVSGNKAWQNAVHGANPNTTIVLVIGPTRKILRATILPVTVVEEIKDTKAFSGQTYNLATLIPTRFHEATTMGVSQLALLGAYTVRTAHEIDPVYVDGLDIAVYADSTLLFQIVPNPEYYWERARRIDDKIRRIFNSEAF